MKIDERRLIRWTILGVVLYSAFGRNSKAFGRAGRLRDATGGSTTRDDSTVIGTPSGHAAGIGLGAQQ